MSSSRLELPLLAEATIILRLLRRQPIFVGFNVTSRCTMRCPFCSVPQLSHREMTLPEVEHVLDRLVEIGIPVVGITGGEPFLRKDLADIIRATERRGMKCTVVTNGDLLDRQRMTELADIGNIVHFALSLDSLDRATYERLRGRAEVGRTLQRFVSLLRYGPKTTYKLNIVLGPDNVDEVDSFLDLAAATGLALSFIPMNVGPGGLHRGETFHGLDREHRERVARAFEYLRERKLAGAPLWDHRDFYRYAARYMRMEPMGDCLAGELFLDLRSNGGLAFCNELDHFVDLLSLEHLSLRDIARHRKQWQPRITACQQNGACCYTCSYNVTATAQNIPAYVWDYLRLRLPGLLGGGR